jgi:hypothetical protein
MSQLGNRDRSRIPNGSSIGKRTPIREAARIRLLSSEILVQRNAPSRRNSASTYLRICDKSTNNPSGGPDCVPPGRSLRRRRIPKV